MNKATSPDPSRYPSVVSIDPPMSSDLDDAVSATPCEDGGYVVDVCLPDVPRIVSPGDAADLHARDVGFTRYGGSFIRRGMFAQDVVAKLSLSPGGPRPMVWIRLHLSPDLEVRKLEIERIRHRTRARLTYLQADEALLDPSRPLHAEVSNLWELSQRLYAKRHAATGALFDAGDGLYTSEEGMLRMLGAKESHQSHLIVMETMILTNSALAAHAQNNGIPILYRNHKPTDTSTGFRRSIVEELSRVHAEGMEQATERLKRLGARIGPAGLGLSPEGHWGLDLPSYAWFTSPLRRYCDVVNLRALLDGYADPELADLAERLTTLYVEEKERSGAYHADRARRAISGHVQAGRGSMLAEYDLHTILRACAEAEVQDDVLVDDVRRRMGDGTLSGKDLEYVFTYGREILHETVVAEVVEWIMDDDRVQLAFTRDLVQRQRLVRISTLPGGGPAVAVAMEQVSELFQFDLPEAYRAKIAEEKIAMTGRAPASASKEVEVERQAAPVPHPNPKGALLELAATRKAKVAFDQGGREGPPHRPWFTVAVTWTHKATIITKNGSGPTLKHAEKAASFALLTAIESAVESAVEAPARPTMDLAAHPKSVLLEHAAVNDARLEIGRPEVSGPPHAPRFRIEAIYRRGREERRGTGCGSSKKQAEREACAELLRMMAAS